MPRLTPGRFFPISLSFSPSQLHSILLTSRWDHHWNTLLLRPTRRQFPKLFSGKIQLFHSNGLHALMNVMMIKPVTWLLIKLKGVSLNAATRKKLKKIIDTRRGFVTLHGPRMRIGRTFRLFRAFLNLISDRLVALCISSSSVSKLKPPIGETTKTAAFPGNDALLLHLCSPIFWGLHFPSTTKLITDP